MRSVSLAPGARRSMRRPAWSQTPRQLQAELYMWTEHAHVALQNGRAARAQIIQ